MDWLFDLIANLSQGELTTGQKGGLFLFFLIFIPSLLLFFFLTKGEERKH